MEARRVIDRVMAVVFVFDEDELMMIYGYSP